MRDLAKKSWHGKNRCSIAQEARKGHVSSSTRRGIARQRSDA